MFVIRCPKCGFGQEIDFGAREWLCPKCGTKCIRITAIVLQIKNIDHWLSDEQIKQILDKTTTFADHLIYSMGQGRNRRVGYG